MSSDKPVKPSASSAGAGYGSSSPQSSAREQETCPICGGSTWVLDDNNEPVPCKCRQGRLRRARTSGIISTIPRKFSGIALSDDGRKITDSGRPLEFSPGIEREVLKYCRNIDKMLAAGRGLWFTGEPGTGKTTLAMLVSRCAHE